MRREVGATRASGEDGGALFGSGTALVFADEIHGGFEVIDVNANANEIFVQDFTNGTASKAFGADVADAGAGGDAGEAGIGEQGDVFAKGKVFEHTGDLVSFFHAGAKRADAG